jgi:N-acetylglucosamine-6-phosphate deacetylase
MTSRVDTVLQIIHSEIPAEFAPSPGVHGLRLAQVQVAGGQIQSLHNGAHGRGIPSLDATGCVLLPGFIDLHVHGAAGADTMDATPEALATMAAFYARHGVTAFLATTMTAPLAEIEAAIRTAARYHAQQAPGARLLGVHVEGPFISPEFPGAQLADYIRPPSVAELARLLDAGPVRMITLAPEQPGAQRLVDLAQARQVLPVMGHTSATFEQCRQALAWGVRQATHTYNAMSGLHHRQPGALGAVLALDGLDAQLIADNIHVHPAAMSILARCKGPAQTLLITDAIRATGLPPGEYDLGGQPVTVAAGACRLANGTLAGSILTMERGLANFMAATGLSIDQAWPASSRTAARSLGMEQQVGCLCPGGAADLVLLDKQLEVVATLVAGEVVYLRDPERLTNP